ncbi:hypothetical protein [Nonomuraea sp. B12E4]|uniref:hypothetical protein n=1 Tax=Nonomuraea sp. B12E4 TaxID=3153564 RepID=UPI00325FC929
MALVDVVHVIVVRDGHVPALGTVLVAMALVRDVPVRPALVHVILVEAMQAAVVNVVDVITMRNRHMPATGPVPVGVIGMLAMLGAH